MKRQRHTDFYIPVLKVLEDLKEHEVNSLIAATADFCRLTDEERKEKTRKGSQLKFESNIQWAITDLCQGGFINRTDRGVYTMAFDGLLMLEDKPEHPDRDYLEARSEKFSDFRHRKGTRNKKNDSSATNLFTNLQEEDIEQDEPSVVEKISETRISSDAAEMLKKCLIAKEAMINAELDTALVDAKIKLLQEGILRNKISSEIMTLINSIKGKNIENIAIVINLFSTERKAYIIHDNEFAQQICDSATYLCEYHEDEIPSESGNNTDATESVKTTDECNNKSNVISQGKKNPPKRLRVTFDDGTVIEGKYAADVFASAIEKIGAEKVAELGLASSGFPLVGKTAPSKYQYKEIGGDFFVPVNSPTHIKKKFLDEIASKLSISIKTEIL